MIYFEWIAVLVTTYLIYQHCRLQMFRQSLFVGQKIGRFVVKAITYDDYVLLVAADDSVELSVPRNKIHKL